MNAPTAVAAPVTPATGFLTPDPDLSGVTDLVAHFGLRTYSGHRATFKSYRGRNRLLDAIGKRIESTPIDCEDQCSARHYVDLFDLVRAHYGVIDRVVEVGVFLGGASTMLAGAATACDFALDLVDVNERFLRFTHERIRRTFPEAVDRVRLFHGDLPSYVQQVMLRESPASALVHHDGSHHFTQVVKDLAALSFVRDQLQGIALQDTHLRGRIEHCNFVDAAVYAVFGFNVACQPIGASYPAGSSQTEPNRYQGNYFLPDTAEGMFVPMAGNEFRYPHPSMKLEEFLPGA